MIDKNSWIYKTAVRLWPSVADMEGIRQAEAVTLFLPLLTMLPFAIIGLVWLILITDIQRLTENPTAFVLVTLVLLLLQNQTFTIRIKLAGDDHLGLTSSLAGLVLWSAALIVGPSALWMIVISSGLEAVWRGWRYSRYDTHPVWPSLTNLVQILSGRVFAMLVALTVYVALGGAFPLVDASVEAWGPVIVATLVSAVIPGFLVLPTGIGYNRLVNRASSFGEIGRFFIGAVALTLITSPFSLLAALIFISGATIAFVVFILGVFLVNAMAHYLSEARDKSRRRAREFEELGNLGEELLKAPADPSLLNDLLESHLGDLFPEDHVEIRLFEVEGNNLWQPMVLYHPSRHQPVADELWDRLCTAKEATIIEPKVVLPGHKAPYGDAILAKIQALRVGDDGDESICLGGIYLLRNHELGKSIEALDSVQSLASQIASALYRYESHAETAAKNKMEQELEFAGHIQNSFLPTSIPDVGGWQVAAVLESARQTSGDFYDFVPLDDDHLGILVADVSDKGTGAALYMALSRTLIRTYAMNHPQQPDIAFGLANERIMADTHTEQFVTAFYGVLNIHSGLLTYANAGHNPPYLIRGSNGKEVEALSRTGIPLGMFEEMKWESAQTNMDSGDVLLMYTDGVTEAQNIDDELYDDDRLIAVGSEKMGEPALEIQQAVVNSIHDFVGEAPQFDDITLVVLSRDSKK